MKLLSLLMAFTLFGALAFGIGMRYGASRQPVEPIKNVVLQSREDVYNVYMLKNCLIELRSLKEGK